MNNNHLSAGDLRHRIVIQRQVKTQDQTTGEMLITWEDAFTNVAASVEPLSVREFLAAQATQSEISARIVIRARAGVDATMRIIHRGQVFNIEGVLRDKDSGIEYFTLPVSEGANEIGK